MVPDWVHELGASYLGRRPFVARRPPDMPALGPVSEIDHIQWDFRQWDGPIGDWQEHFGKGRGQVYPLDGGAPEPSCNEVEVAKQLRRVRQHAYWFSGYQAKLVPARWKAWVLSLGTEALDLTDWLVIFDRAVRERIDSKKGGMPDVVAWNDSDALGSAIFVECKARGETAMVAQEDWVWAAQRAGLDLSQIAVSVRPF
jgi:hypothetical protein